MNRVFMIGRMVRDIEIKNLQNDKKVGNFTLAVNRESNREKVGLHSMHSVEQNG